MKGYPVYSTEYYIKFIYKAADYKLNDITLYLTCEWNKLRLQGSSSSKITEQRGKVIKRAKKTIAVL